MMSCGDIPSCQGCDGIDNVPRVYICLDVGDSAQHATDLLRCSGPVRILATFHRVSNREGSLQNSEGSGTRPYGSPIAKIGQGCP